MTRQLHKIPEAAELLGISTRQIYRLIEEADVSKKSTWRHGREIITLSTRSALRRTLRINVDAVLQQ